MAGALAAIYDKPAGTYAASHDQCAAVSCSGDCVFQFEVGTAAYATFDSTGGASDAPEHLLLPVPENNVDYEGIFSALTSMEIVGDEPGTIPAFGVYLTRHYANDYNRISFETEKAMEKMFGSDGIEATKPLFVEAGHVCALNTFGGIMTSTEWDALIKSSLKHNEDWVHGMVAAVDALSWGRRQVTALSEQEATFVIHDDYESVGYEAMYGKSDHPDHPVSYLAEGAAIGIMNLVYRGDVSSKPKFTHDFYEHLFKNASHRYEADTLTSKAMGDEFTTIRVAAA